MLKSEHNLLPELINLGINERELGNSFSIYFGCATGPYPGDTMYVHRGIPGALNGQDNQCKFKLVAGKGGRLKGIYAGKGLSEEDYVQFKDSILRDIVNDSGVIVCSEILFCKPLVVKGWWRYRDLFQIQPVPSYAPQVKHTLGPNPFVVEYKLKYSPRWEVRLNRRYWKMKELVYLLNAFLEGQIYLPSRNLDITWGLVGDVKNAESVISVKKGYKIKDFQEEKNTFDALSEIEQIQSLPFQSYNRGNLSVSPDHSLRIPDSLEKVFDAYFSLSEAYQNKFMTASYWLNHADESKNARSASFVALVQVIEALLPKIETKTCEKCGQPEYKLAQSFVSFLDHYAPGNVFGVGRKKLYSVRSELAHGKRLMASDCGGVITWEDDGTWEEMRQVVKSSLYNWVLDMAKRDLS